MSTIPFGLLLLALVSWGLISGTDLSLFFNFHSSLIVFGGTFAVFFLSVPRSVSKSVFQVIWRLFKFEKGFKSQIDELNRLIRSKSVGESSDNELIRYASQLWTQGLDQELFVALLSQKKSELESGTADSLYALKNLAKYPPALGMIGTVMGMIALFSSLDTNRSEIGQHLSLAMTATFLGLILTNAFLSPIADRVQMYQIQHQRVLQKTYEVLLLINNNEPSSLIEEEVNLRAG